MRMLLFLPHVMVLFTIMYKTYIIGKIDDPYQIDNILNWKYILLGNNPKAYCATIQESIGHVYLTLDKYHQLPKIAVGQYEVENTIALRVVSYNNTAMKVTTMYNLVGGNHKNVKWPKGLNVHATDNARRAFFNDLYALTMYLNIKSYLDKPVLWVVKVTFDFKSQVYLQVGLIAQQLSPSVSEIPKHTIIVDIVMCILVVVYQSILMIQIFIARKRLQQTAMQIEHYEALIMNDAIDNVHETLVKEKHTISASWIAFITITNVITLCTVFVQQQTKFGTAYDSTYRILFGMASTGQWMSCCRYFEVNQRYRILKDTLKRGVPGVARFLFGVLPIFGGYVVFGTIMFGAQVERFESLRKTATTLFAVMNGDEILSTFNMLTQSLPQPWIAQIYIFSYIVIFTYVVLMVCIGIIEDSFYTALRL